ncbi:DUF6458 family protein [Spirillospora sp. NPDC049652]
MGIGVSLAFIALGMILAFAVRVDLSGLDIHLVGWILILVGLISMVFTYTYTRPRRRSQQIMGADPGYDVEPDRAIVEEHVVERPEEPRVVERVVERPAEEPKVVERVIERPVSGDVSPSDYAAPPPAAQDPALANDPAIANDPALANDPAAANPPPAAPRRRAPHQR